MLCVWLLVALCLRAKTAELPWQAKGPYRFLKLPAFQESKVGFELMDASLTGLNFTNRLATERWVTNQIYLGGSGVAAGDVNGDGLSDLYFCGLDSVNALYINEGDWRFRRVESASLNCEGDASTGAVLADVDGDGDLDLLVGGLGHGVRLFLNDGKGHFAEGTDAAGLRSRGAVTSLALADVDGDRDLDLYAATYGLTSMADEPPKQFRLTRINNRLVVGAINGRQLTREESKRYTVNSRSGEVQEDGDPDLFYVNEGGKFALVPWGSTFLTASGKPAEAPYDWSLSVMFRDMNADGWPDIYVCNDHHSEDAIWINRRDGTFQPISEEAIRHTSLASMGIDFADINRDGFDDFFVVDMLSPDEKMRLTQLPDRHGLHPPGGSGVLQYLRNTLFLNRGDTTYSEIACLAGLESSDWSWMPLFLDADLDGYEDVFITTGIEKNFRDADFQKTWETHRRNKKLNPETFYSLRRALPEMRNPNYVFRNNGDLTFADASKKWGFDSTQLSHGMCMADLDNDGDSDLVINCLNAPPLLYKNETTAPRILVRVRGTAPNTQGIGAKIKVHSEGAILQQEIISGGRYLSSDDGSRSFAALRSKATINVKWRDGTATIVSNVPANTIIEINQTGSFVISEKKTASDKKWFAEIPTFNGLKHHEEFFNDLDRQPLLHKLLSQQGPGLAWGDLNRDGWDDLVMGQGRGGTLAFLLNDQKGGFQKLPVGEQLGPLPGDAAGILILPAGNGGAEVVFGMSNYEGDTNAPSVANLLFQKQGISLGPGLTGLDSAVGALAAADVDGNGTIEILVAGHVQAGNYPEPVSCAIYIRNGPNLTLKQTIPIEGVVNSALFSDLNNDGFPELVLARELGPLEIFANQKGAFVNATKEWRMNEHAGMWNSITACDVNNDGRMDLAAGNWGRNTRWERLMKSGYGIYFADADRNGITELIDCTKFKDEWIPSRHLSWLQQAIPAVAVKFASHQEFAGSPLRTFIEPAQWKHSILTTLETSIFINNGQGFERKALPIEAQFSPVMGISAGDFNLDGNVDLFLGQNFFAVDRETSRYDAGRGLVLKGDGKGNFTCLNALQSGIAIYGEMRATALADFNRDGILDIAVGQNAAEFRLYCGTNMQPGIQVTLLGPPGNPAGIGAQIRSEISGPVYEISAGSGFLSQNSAVAIMPFQKEAWNLRVVWPGGQTDLVTLPGSAREVVVEWRKK